jgi:hypothetical protein
MTGQQARERQNAAGTVLLAHVYGYRPVEAILKNCGGQASDLAIRY